jgi:hypothetical protein
MKTCKLINVFNLFYSHNQNIPNLSYALFIITQIHTLFIKPCIPTIIIPFIILYYSHYYHNLISPIFYPLFYKHHHYTTYFFCFFQYSYNSSLNFLLAICFNSTSLLYIPYLDFELSF